MRGDKVDTVTKRFTDKGYTVEVTYPKESLIFQLVSVTADDDKRVRSFEFAALPDNELNRLRQAYNCEINDIDTNVYLIAEHMDRCYFRPFYILLQGCRKGHRPSVLWGKTFFFAVSHLLKTT